MKLFTYLTAFSQSGGIEKFNRSFIKVLDNLYGKDLVINSLHDSNFDANYLQTAHFKGFGGSKITYLLKTIHAAVSSKTLIIGHINLSLVAFVVKFLSPKTELILVTHGIEVWGKISYVRRKVLMQADKILAVSEFTKNKLIEVHSIDSKKIHVFWNTIDSNFEYPIVFDKSKTLLERYQIAENQKIILTICRMSSNEGYKGYDRVLLAMPQVLQVYPDAIYMLVGKYDRKEYERLHQIIRNQQLDGKVIFTDFIDDNELIDHFLLGDVFVMPSKNEGFGIVFIEAMACGLPVIAGNQDGSTDALDHGALGELINPDSSDDIANSIINTLKNRGLQTLSFKKELQHKVIDKFGFERYQKRLKSIIDSK